MRGMHPAPSAAAPAAAAHDAAGAPFPAERALLPDLARGAALFGIAVVNVAMFAYPVTTGYTPEALARPVDQAAYFLVMALFALKSYSLFAMMFGAGLGQQLDAAQRQGRRAGGPYLRRLLGLALFGAFNVWALFHGDILLLYASFGVLLWLFRRRSAQSLARWGWGFYTLQVLLLAALAALMVLWQLVAPEEVAAEAARTPALLAQAQAGFGAAGFFDVARYRVQAWLEAIGPGLLLQGAGAMAFMLFGLATLRRGLLQDPAHPQWRRCRRLWLPVGLVLSAAAAQLMLQAGSFITPDAMLGLVLLTVASPASTAGYLGLLALWAQQPPSALRNALARAGSASLSAYLLQGLLLSLVFCGYGLGLYGQLGAAACIAVAAVAGLGSIAALAAWRQRHGRGPCESLLRAFTARPRG